MGPKPEQDRGTLLDQGPDRKSDHEHGHGPRQEPDRDGVRPVRRGKVWLVGAGPGDPDLLTVRAHALIASASVLAFDELVSPAILALAPAGAERIPVGRRAHGCRHHEARIHPLVVLRALQGCDVVRLKGGDPLVFARGGEVAEELAAARVPFEFVPGISAALAAAATTRIPLTHRECASSVTFVTAHAASDPGPGGSEGGEPSGLLANVPERGTLVFYMGLGRIAETCAALIAGGRAPHTPAAVVSRASLPDERFVLGTLADAAERAAAAGLEAPALLFVGEVVARRIEGAYVDVRAEQAKAG
jgi:uroporphyrin-III C-methyltransferase